MTEPSTYQTTGPLTIDRLVDLTSPAEPCLSPDGSRLLYTQTIGAAKHVFVVPTAGGWPMRLTSGELTHEEPRWSPDGKQIVYLADKSIKVMGADGANPRTLTEHPAGSSLPRWSPDGSHIAFYSRRHGWSQIWTVPATGGEPRRLTATQADNDGLAWSPDSRKILYSSIRGDDLLNSDVYSVDVQTGVERRLTDGPSCFAGAPSWSPDGRQIAFLSDQDGWIHVYVVNADGSGRRQITTGECEDGWPNLNRGYLLWSPDGRGLAFIRNHEGKVDLMMLKLPDGPVNCLSHGEGLHRPVAWLPDGSGLVSLEARPDAPPDLWLLNVDGRTEQITRSLAGGLREADFVAPERVSFESRDGLTLYGYLYRPKSTQLGEGRPAIVHPHGGPTAQAFFTWEDPILQLFVQEGYAVLSPDFRGSSGYGKAFRLANAGKWGVADALDCLDAAAYLRRLNWVDGDRIGIWGGSYGGYLVLCALTMAPDVFRAGIDLFGDSELAESYRHGDRLGRLDLQRQMGSPDENLEAYRRGSPIYRAERIEAPLLILHGRDDRRVVPLMSERMIEALQIEGKFFEHHYYDGEGHGFRKPANRRDAYQRMLAFFERYLKGKFDLH